MKTGICSITFRQLSLSALTELVVKAGLEAIEWGGDVHVPHGNLTAAEDARRLTVDAGLEVSSYGSYYKVLDEKNEFQDFTPVLESALTLGTDTVRIWAGNKESSAADVEYRRIFADRCREIAAQAEPHNVRIAFEFHNNSLTDTNESAAQLLQEINHPNIYIYWQPMYWGPDMDYRLQGLESLREKILNFHVFHWKYDSSRETWAEAVSRRPLCEGEGDWHQYLAVKLPVRKRYALLEFVRCDSPGQFLDDAAVLKEWVDNRKKNQ